MLKFTKQEVMDHANARGIYDTLPKLFGNGLLDDELVGVALCREGAQVWVGFYDSDHFDEAAYFVAGVDLTGEYEAHICTSPISRAAVEKMLEGHDHAINEHYKVVPGLGISNDLVSRRQFVFLDFDPRKNEDGEVTDEYREQALAAAEWCRGYLERYYMFQGGILASSGNGTHLLFPIEEANSEESKALITGIQTLVGQKVNEKPEFQGVKVDVLADAKRLTKYYGVSNRKRGECRPTRIINGHLSANVRVSTERLQKVAGKANLKSKQIAVGPPAAEALANAIQDHIDGAGEPSQYTMDGNSHKWMFRCPYNLYEDGCHSEDDDDGTKFAIWLAPDGKVTCSCHHSCIRKDGREFNGQEALRLLGDDWDAKWNSAIANDVINRLDDSDGAADGSLDGLSGQHSPHDPPGEGAAGVDGVDSIGDQVMSRRQKPEPIVYWGDTPVNDRLDMVTARLHDTGEAFHDRERDLIRIDSQGNYQVIEKDDDLGAFLLAKGVEVCKLSRTKTGSVKETYGSLPKDHAQKYLNKNYAANRKLDEIRIYSRNPIYDANWNLCPPGFDPDSGVYYAGEAVHPKSGTSAIDELLSEVCFKDEASRVNFIGMLLTCIVINKVGHQKPVVLITGNQPEIGKTTLGQRLAIVQDGQDVPTITYLSDDNKLENDFATKLKAGRKTFLIDNVKEPIKSAVLEKCATDAVLAFRLLHTNNDISKENAHLFVITANTPDCGPDIVTRSIFISLEYEGEPKERDLLADPIGQAIELRDSVLAELVGMIEKWKTDGMPLADDVQARDRQWGQIVGGILRSNGYIDSEGNSILMSNYREASGDVVVDEGRDAFEGLLLESIAPSINGADNAKTTREIIENCTDTYFDGVGINSQIKVLGKKLAKYKGQEFGSRKLCHKRLGSKGAIYWLEGPSEQA